MSGAPTDFTAFILAGGNSTRMGTDKAFVMLEGRTLLARALEVCRTVTSDVRIVGDRKKFAPFAPVVEDVFPGCGPLAGIHAGLRDSETDWNVVLAVDLPFVSPALLLFLVAQARESRAMVTVPRAGEGWQPLCAIYRRAFADAAETALRAGRYKIDALFDESLIRPVGEEDLRRAGFSPEVFRNLNTPKELAEARNS
ncbi:MAG: molybdenum cofactor guanylyltransferase [Acidobacteria bacterium]|nr:MAG: molybdenum cofactor guanylyltransferase [Acidobacteriota bacterium]